MRPAQRPVHRGGALAHPVQHLRVGGAVAEPGPRGDRGPDLAEQGAGVSAGVKAAEQPRGEALGVAVVLDPVASVRAPARTARPTRWARTDFVIEAPRKSVSGPSPATYHSCTTRPSTTTSSEVLWVASRHAASSHVVPAPTASAASSRGADGRGCVRGRRPRVRGSSPARAGGSMNPSVESRGCSAEPGTGVTRSWGCSRAACGCTPPSESP